MEDSSAIEKLHMQLVQLAETVQTLSHAIHVNTKARLENVEGYIQTESKVNESEVSKGAHQFLEKSGYTVTPLEIHKIYDHVGQVFVEWDGILVAEKGRDDRILAVVESKHRVLHDHIENRLEYLQRFQQYLVDLRREDRFTSGRAGFDSVRGALKPFCTYKLMLFIGGPHFKEHVAEFARENGVYCVTTNGERYKVQTPFKGGELINKQA